MENKQMLIVGKDSTFLRILYCYLLLKIPNSSLTLVCEKKESYFFFLKRRIKKIGILTVIGQLFFIFFVVIPQTFFSRRRINAILNANGLNLSKIEDDNIIYIDSINSNSFHNILLKKNWSNVILCGSRIVSKKTLDIAKCKFINIHAGITPFYRGVHGLYWALYNREFNRAGVTLHYVDTGIDTGNIISQELVNISKDDNFSTYPYLQFCSGLKLLLNFLDFPQKIQNYSFNDELEISKLYYHPTIIQYVSRYFKYGVK
jgi:hypothetical protein